MLSLITIKWTFASMFETQDENGMEHQPYLTCASWTMPMFCVPYPPIYMKWDQAARSIMIHYRHSFSGEQLTVPACYGDSSRHALCQGVRGVSSMGNLWKSTHWSRPASVGVPHTPLTDGLHCYTLSNSNSKFTCKHCEYSHDSVTVYEASLTCFSWIQ